MTYDVIVCGAGTSGMNAAIAASRNGARVLIIEQSGVLGGTNVLSLVGPLMTFHGNEKQIVGGIAQEIVERLQKKQGTLGHIKDPLAFCSTITPVDIESLKQLYFDMVLEEDIDVLFHTFITGVTVENNKLKHIYVVNKSGSFTIKGKTFIDATGDGDVAYKAGCKFKLGREEDNLCQPMTMLFTVGNVNLNEVREYMKNNPEDFVLGDKYNYEYIAVSGFFSKVKEAVKKNDFDLPRDRVLFFQDVNKNEVTINMTRVLGLNGTDAYSMSKAEIIGRQQIHKAFEFLRKYIPGFESCYIVKTPESIGVRESRHIVGKYTLNANDILTNKSFTHSIAVGAFPIDIHSPSGVDLHTIANRDDLSYEIPQEVMYVDNVDNLIITGRCVSATHEASASLRVGPTVMALGQAAGVIASLSAAQGKNISDVDYNDIKDVLLSQKQIIKK